MNRLRFPQLFALALPFAALSCGQKEEPKPQAAVQETPAHAPVAAPAEEAKPAQAPEAPAPAPAMAEAAPAAPQLLTSELGEFGSSEPIERTDLPQRGIISFNTEKKNEVFMPAEHWEQYNFPFTARRSGRYKVRVNYTLKSSSLGVQLKLGEDRLKKQLKNSSSLPTVTYLGEITIAQPGDQFMAFYTPSGVAWSSFVLHGIDLIPAAEGEDIKAAEDGTVQLLARHAVTWSENMRYEPKAEKDCLGYWTEKDDFAEWEFTVDKPGSYHVTIHQGCGAGGGSEVAVQLGEQQLEFKVKDTGGFQNWAAVPVGELKIDKPGTYRLAVKPQSKNGGAIMDIQKVVLAPVS